MRKFWDVILYLSVWAALLGIFFTCQYFFPKTTNVINNGAFLIFVLGFTVYFCVKFYRWLRKKYGKKGYKITLRTNSIKDLLEIGAIFYKVKIFDNFESTPSSEFPDGKKDALEYMLSELERDE